MPFGLGWLIVGYVAGAGLLAAGLWLVTSGRRSMKAGKTGAGGGHAAPALGLSGPTRLAIGLVLLMLGYHAAAWVSPSAWFALKAPLDRWWVVAGAGAVGVFCSLVSDRLERA